MSRTGDRAKELGAYAGGPFGAALLVASQVLDRQVLPRATAVILMAIGAGALIAAFQILRSLPAHRERPSFALRAVVAIAPVAAVGVAIYALAPAAGSAPSEALDRVAFHYRELGGLTIALPDGNEASDPRHTAGVLIDRVGGLELGVAVIWQLGAFDDDSARTIARAGAARVGSAAPEPLPDTALVVGDGLPHRSFQVPARNGSMSITVFGCNRRVIGVLTAGPGAPELARRVLTTVRCPVDPDAPGAASGSAAGSAQ